MKTLIPIILIATGMSSCQNPSNQNHEKMNNEKANQTLIEQYFTHFNNHDWKQMVELYIDEPEMKDPAYGIKSVKMTRAEIEKKYTELNSMIPDVRDDIIAVYHAGDNVIVEFVSSGTAPDSTKFELPICTIFEIKKGKITKDLTYYDNFEGGQN